MSDEIIGARQKTHGDFSNVSELTIKTMDVWRESYNWDRLSHERKMALYEVAHKVARILSGDPDHPDHWDDIGGYALLGRRDGRRD